MPVCTDPLLDERRHNANYSVPPEEDIRILKLKAENKFLYNSTILLMVTIAAVLLIETYVAYQFNKNLGDSEMIISNFGNDIKYPFLVVDHITPLEDIHNLNRLPICMIYQVDKP